MAAVPVIVNHRLPMIDAATRDPLGADYRELYTMVSEKVEAGLLAAMSLAQDYQAILAALLQPSRSIFDHFATSMRIGELVAGAAGRALAPVHKRAAVNAKRLGPQRWS